MPLHPEEHLDSAVVNGSEAPLELPEPVEWRFDQPQTPWRAVPTVKPGAEPARVVKSEEGFRVTLCTEITETAVGVRISTEVCTSTCPIGSERTGGHLDSRKND